MISRRTSAFITLAVALIAIAIPIMGSIHIVRQQAIEAEMRHVLTYAKDVLHRTESTTDQIAAGFEQVGKVAGDDPCSSNALSEMRHVDLTSTYLQAVGVEHEGRLICSSLGDVGVPVILGPVDFVTGNGTTIRKDVRFPFAEGKSFIVVGQGHYAAIVHKDLPIDTSTEEENASLATFMVENHLILTSRGRIKPDWMARLGEAYETTFVDERHVVAVVRSKRYLSGAIAAIPVSHLSDRMQSLAMILIPLGLVSGVMLALAVRYMVKVQLGMPSVIKTGLRRDEFFLVYQPLVNLQTGQWVGAEALIRWRRPNGEMIRPDAFIPVAEDTGLIVRITQRVLEIIGRDSRELFRRFPEFHVAVNLSAEDLNSKDIVALLQQTLSEAQAGGRNLMVEATERGFMHGQTAKAIMREVRSLGISVAIDDFGTGYSSLSYLEKFELDYLKIDKSFVDTVGTDAPTNNVVVHIIAMAKTLNLRMIAEGVETEAQAQFLRERGVQYAQGWLFAKPMPLDELLSKMPAAPESAQA